MSSYRRFISYMHQYQNGKKGINCGFVKIEIKNGQCTLLFQMKKLPANTTLALSFFIRAENSVKQIPIWDGLCPKGIFNERFVTDSLHLFKTNYSFEQCAGILLNQGEQVLCGTCWDKIGTIPTSKVKNDDVIQANETINNNTEPITETLNDNAESIAETANDNAESSTETANDNTIPINEISRNVKKQSTETPPRSFEEIWQSMQKNYPPLDPFEEGGIVEGIKISPSDLPYLQLLQFDLGANRFLLHGYKNYKHLLLGRMEGQNRYILGIPGIYDSQEQFMARMFGFPCFKPIRSCRKPIGQFGYWFRCIHS